MCLCVFRDWGMRVGEKQIVCVCVCVCVETEVKCAGRDGVLGVDIWEMCRRRDEVCVEGETKFRSLWGYMFMDTGVWVCRDGCD